MRGRPFTISVKFLLNKTSSLEGNVVNLKNNLELLQQNKISGTPLSPIILSYISRNLSDIKRITIQAEKLIEKKMSNADKNDKKSLAVVRKVSNQDNHSNQAPNADNRAVYGFLLMVMGSFVGNFVASQATDYLKKYLHSHHDIPAEFEIPDAEPFISPYSNAFKKALDEFEVEIKQEKISVENLEEKIDSLVEIFERVKSLHDDYATDAHKKKHSPGVADNLAKKTASLAEALGNLHNQYHEKMNSILDANQDKVKKQVIAPEPSNRLKIAFDKLRSQEIKSIIPLADILEGKVNNEYLEGFYSIFSSQSKKNKLTKEDEINNDNAGNDNTKRPS